MKIANRYSITQNNNRRKIVLIAICGISLAAAAGAQSLIRDDFNDGNDAGWVRYAPHQASGNATVAYTFPSDGAGGNALRIAHEPPIDRTLGPARAASFRTDGTGADFFTAVDIFGWDDRTPENFGGLLGRVPNPGSPPLNGYLVSYFVPGNLNDPVTIFGNLKFVAEGVVFVDFIDTYHGGVAQVSRLDPTRKYRVSLSGSNDVMRAALYDRFDLLEPIAKLAFRDAEFPSGAPGVVTVNANDTRRAEWTFDNFYTSLMSDDMKGYPGTPQVVNLHPPPQKLFYNPQSTPPISFELRTYSNTQINTNAFRLVLNNVDVTAQCTLTDVSPFLMPRTAFEVRYPGPLTNDTVYYGKIIVNDTTGLGTTNTWTFDTFLPFDDVDPFHGTGRTVIEVEDYNHSGGSYHKFDTSVPVSGLDNNGVAVGGGGAENAGYYNTAGVPEIDFHDGNSANVNLNQYRPSNPVGIIQDRRQTGDTPRQKHVTANVPDYTVVHFSSGDWMNYTRDFPTDGTGNYRVYLRCSSQKAQSVLLHEVTSDPAQPNQVVCPRGVFRVPNTGGSTRFRYIPLTDGAGRDAIVSVAGTRTLRITTPEAQTYGELSDLQLNYILLVPVSSGAGLLGPWIPFASPAADSSTADPETKVRITILNRDRTVNPSSVQLAFDGVDVTASTTSTPNTECAGLNLAYDHPTALPPRSSHTLRLIYSDSGGISQTQTWSFTIKDMLTMPPGYANPGSGLERGFIVKMHKAPNSADGNLFPNSASRAENQLAGTIIDPATSQPYPNEAGGLNGSGVFGESSGLNYDQGGASTGNIGNDNTYPGIPPSDANNIAMAATAYLELAPGVYRIGGLSDDGFRVTAGPTLPGTNLLVGELPGCCSTVEFEFYVQTAGFYPFRFLHWEGGGGAHVEFFSVDRRTGAKTLINDLAAPNAIRAWRAPGQDLNLPSLSAANALPLGSGSSRGLAVTTHKARNDAPEGDFPNNADRAERQLAGQIIDASTGQPYQNQSSTPTSVQTVINFEQAGLPAGFFPGETAFPGVDPTLYGNDPNFIALGATAYLELPAGRYRLGVRSDDGFRVTSGAGITAQTPILGGWEGGRPSSATEFEFIVPTTGLYPFRFIGFEGTGGADTEFYSLNVNTGERLLINANHPNAIKAWQIAGATIINPRLDGATFKGSFATSSGKTYHVEYKDTLAPGQWTLLTTFSGDGQEKTFTDTRSSPTRFYQLRVE